MKKELIKEILRFLIVGLIATLCDYAVFYLFNLVIFKAINETLNIILSTFLGFVTGLIINWIFSINFVFRYKKKTTSTQFIIYLVISVIGLAITEFGMLIAKPLFGTYEVTFIVTFDFWKLFFKCMMTLIVLVWNYIGRKFLVFRKDKEEEINEKKID